MAGSSRDATGVKLNGSNACNRIGPFKAFCFLTSEIDLGNACDVQTTFHPDPIENRWRPDHSHGPQDA